MVLLSKIDRYVGMTVLWSVLFVMLTLLGLDFIITFIDQIQKVNERFTTSSLLLVLGYGMPGKFAEYLPVSCLIGTLVGLGALATTSEITVIRAAGTPIWRIGISACQPILVLALAGLSISQYVSPVADQKALILQQSEQRRVDDFSLQGGTWVKVNGNYVYINAADANQVLYGLRIFDRDDVKLNAIIDADKAIYLGNDKWRLEGVRKTIFTPDKVMIETQPEQNWQATLQPRHLYLSTQEPANLSLTELYEYASYLTSEGLNDGPYSLELWTKLLRPLSSIALVIVAMSTVFGPLRSSSMGGRIFSGVIIGVAFQNGLSLFGRMSLLTSIPPFMGVMIPILVCFAIGLILIRRKS
jgi:lipopolysaccharide export system permease protein